MKTPLRRLLDTLLVLAALAVFGIGFYIALNATYDGPIDCRPVDYHDAGWYNRAGQVVAVAPSEDSVMHYVGDCG